jgi:hypothetical protein
VSPARLYGSCSLRQRYRVADVDIEIACRKLAAGTETQRDVAAAGIVIVKRKSSVRCVTIAAGVANERISAHCQVVLTGVVIEKRLTADCNISVADQFLSKRRRRVRGRL